MTAASSERWSFLDIPAPVGFAHRGGNEVATENTVAAFAHAVGLGYQYLETDVHLTHDGVLVAFHDTGLERLAGRPGSIAEFTWAELRTIDLGGGARIPSLDDLLTSFPDVRWNIDPKVDDAVDVLCRTIRAHRATERVCIGAFSDARIARARELLGPTLCTSAGPRHTAMIWAAAQGSRALATLGGNRVIRSVATQHGCLQVPPSLRGVRVADPRLVEVAHDLGLAVHVWTINDAELMDTLFELGVDGVMTDKVSVLAGVLRRRTGA